MGNENTKARRWLGWAVALVVVAGAAGAAGWFGREAVSGTRGQEAGQRQESDAERKGRYQEVLRELDAVGDAGDDATRTRCRHAILVLGLMEPGWYKAYRADHPAPAWMSGPPAGGL